MTSTRKTLKTLVNARRGAIVPGAFNALSARVIDDLGFEAIYVNLRPYGGPRALAQFQQAGATVVAVSPLQDSAFLRLP
mgnify:CR=1 FL=1